MHIEQQQTLPSETITMDTPIQVVSFEKEGAYTTIKKELWETLLSTVDSKDENPKTFCIFSKDSEEQAKSIAMVATTEDVTLPNDENFKKLVIDAGEYMVFTVIPAENDNIEESFNNLYEYVNKELKDKVELDSIDNDTVKSGFIETIALDKADPSSTIFKVYFKVKN